jgi:hypothetical protein
VAVISLVFLWKGYDLATLPFLVGGVVFFGGGVVIALSDLLSGTSASLHSVLAALYDQPGGAEVITRQLRHWGPFALYLRSFDVDSVASPRYESRESLDPQRELDRYRHPLEAALAKYFTRDRWRHYFPVVAIENQSIRAPSALVPRPKHSILATYDIARVACTDQTWPHVVPLLAEHANVVIVFIDNPGQGVVREIEMLRKPELAKKTVIVIGARYCGEHDSNAGVMKEWLGGFPHIVFESEHLQTSYVTSGDDTATVMQKIAAALSSNRV